MTPHFRQLLALILVIAWGTDSWSVDVITFENGDARRTVVGNVMVTAQDGGLLVIDRDGVLWMIQPDQLVDRDSSDVPFEASDRKEYAERLLAELPAGFRMRQTPHYVFLYDTSIGYAKWCGTLYERLYRAFYNFWRRKGIALHEPEFPLVAIIFSDRQSFDAFGHGDLGPAVESVVGYYSMRSNLVVMYDLTGVEENRAAIKSRNQAASIQQILSQPASVGNVATIVHEATHQLAFNSGLQTRYADNPLWLSEGLAMFFETPDFQNDKGWKSIGGIHPIRLRDFQQSLAQRTTGSLPELVSNDDRLRDPQTAGAAYAKAWALCYYLFKKHPEPFAAYIEKLADLSPLENVTPEERLALLKEHFGELGKLDANLLEFYRTLD